MAKETIYTADFERSLRSANQPEWLKSLREKAFAYFTEKGFPTVREEDWKYTNVKEVTGGQWSVVGVSDEIKDLSEHIFEESRKSVLVFVDGAFDKNLSNLEALGGAAVLSFAEAVRSEKLAFTFEKNLGGLIDYRKNGFAALNTAFTDNGAFLYLPENARIETPIQLLFISTEGRAAFPRVLVVAEKFAEATVIESYGRRDETEYLTDAVIEIFLADEAKLKHFRVQRESHEAFHIGTTGARLGRGSVYDSTNINLGGKLSRHDVEVEFRAEGGEAFVDGLYMLAGRQHSDTHSLIRHNLPNCISHQNYKGVLNDRSRAVFNGKVFVAEGARGTDAFQSNKNLLLSNDARVDTKPQLEIYNDDVKCAHGATVGQLEEEELFYLFSRGLNEDLARNLLTYGFAEEIINKIEIESIKRQLDEAVLSRLHAELEA
ncbi:MAG: Fe-S cluster assembly protein SufD [Pyrinomonadaceae bacterium]